MYRLFCTSCGKFHNVSPGYYGSITTICPECGNNWVSRANCYIIMQGAN